jgi:hypothetical protein
VRRKAEGTGQSQVPALPKTGKDKWLACLCFQTHYLVRMIRPSQQQPRPVLLLQPHSTALVCVDNKIVVRKVRQCSSRQAKTPLAPPDDHEKLTILTTQESTCGPEP